MRAIWTLPNRTYRRVAKVRRRGIPNSLVITNQMTKARGKVRSLKYEENESEVTESTKKKKVKNLKENNRFSRLQLDPSWNLRRYTIGNPLIE